MIYFIYKKEWVVVVVKMRMIRRKESKVNYPIIGILIELILLEEKQK
jgi:hypothetical protein